MSYLFFTEEEIEEMNSQAPKEVYFLDCEHCSFQNVGVGILEGNICKNCNCKIESELEDIPF